MSIFYIFFIFYIFTIFIIFVRFCLKYYESDHGDAKERKNAKYIFVWLDIDVKEILLLYVVLRQVCFGESDRLRNRQNRRANRQKERSANRQKERKANNQVCLWELDRQTDKTDNTEELR